MPPTNEKLDEIYKLTRENNRMLHAMRRNAFLGTIFKLVLYAAFLIVPLWLYMQYLAPMLTQMQNTMQQVQGTGAQAQAQVQGLQQVLSGLKEYIPALQQ
ncbi:MAG: hypothetical protein RLZZ342_486 [Candidatus Parcubacteria bacterium]|jgi:hypothetical protein